MSFSSDDLEALAAAEEVRIETQAPEGPSHRTVIWVVVDGDEAFVRTYKGPTSRWYREAQANPAVALHVGERRIPATAIPATDPDSVERVSAAFRRKYAGDPATPAMVADTVLPTTLRLEPA
ncbi:MAG TPA: nitroreductase/quinone reductase family protein [Candidatus Limnocylindrales bacterium]|nr:nitroreductase/quinone reductase family protein [Candidatus Limnocylindrales bacterium]